MKKRNERETSVTVMPAPLLFFCALGVSLSAVVNSEVPVQTEPSCSVSAREESSPYFDFGQTHGNDRRRDKTKLTIATYNVEFMFSLNHSCSNPAFDCPGSDCDWKNESMAAKHMSQVARNIAAIDADIWVLPETQDCCVLNWLNQHYLRPLYNTTNQTSENEYYGSPYVEYLRRGVDYTTGQNIGILSKVDPVWKTVQRTSARSSYPRNNSNCSGTWNTQTQGVSKHFFTQIGGFIDDLIPDFLLMGLHLLARPTDGDRCGKREAQASVLIDVLNNHTDVEWLVLGDFNDYDPSILDRNGHEPITHVLKWMKQGSYRVDGGSEGDSSSMSGPGDLINTAQFLSQEDRYTHYSSAAFDGDCEFTDSQTQQLDFVLASPALSDLISEVRIYHDFCGLYNPDHLPLVVTFQSDEPTQYPSQYPSQYPTQDPITTEIPTKNPSVLTTEDITPGDPTEGSAPSLSVPVLFLSGVFATINILL